MPGLLRRQHLGRPLPLRRVLPARGAAHEHRLARGEEDRRRQLDLPARLRHELRGGQARPADPAGPGPPDDGERGRRRSRLRRSRARRAADQRGRLPRPAHGPAEDGTVSAFETRPMAGTLGLGYVVWMSQQWTLQGLGLGDLVYSLPLAPGEQQRVAIFERPDTARVAREPVVRPGGGAPAERGRRHVDAGGLRVGLRGGGHGSSSFRGESDSSSWGVANIIVSGGSGSSSSSGSSSQSLTGQRCTAQRRPRTCSRQPRAGHGRRSAARTGMRLASATESRR